MQTEFNIKREHNNNLYYMEYENDSGIFQFHSPIELYFIDDGKMEVTLNNQKRIFKKGEMSVALSYDSHAYKTVDYSRSSIFIIPTYMCEKFITTVQHKRVINPFILNKKAVKEIKKCIMEIEQKGINDIKLSGYIYVILGIVMENISFASIREPLDPQLSSRILFYINENYKSNITLNSIAANFGYSPSYISRYFKSCFNIGINQYLTNIRLKNALILMQEKKHSLTYCALESGFNSMRTFYRTFYNEFLCTPKEYLKKVQNI